MSHVTKTQNPILFLYWNTACVFTLHTFLFFLSTTHCPGNTCKLAILSTSGRVYGQGASLALTLSEIPLSLARSLSLTMRFTEAILFHCLPAFVYRCDAACDRVVAILPSDPLRSIKASLFLHTTKKMIPFSSPCLIGTCNISAFFLISLSVWSLRVHHVRLRVHHVHCVMYTDMYHEALNSLWFPRDIFDLTMQLLIMLHSSPGW